MRSCLRCLNAFNLVSAMETDLNCWKKICGCRWYNSWMMHYNSLLEIAWTRNYFYHRFAIEPPPPLGMGFLYSTPTFLRRVEKEGREKEKASVELQGLLSVVWNSKIHVLLFYLFKQGKSLRTPFWWENRKFIDNYLKNKQKIFIKCA